MKIKYLSVYLQRNRIKGDTVWSAHVRVRTADGNWTYGPNLFIGTHHKPSVDWETKECVKAVLHKRGLFVEQLEFTS